MSNTQPMRRAEDTEALMMRLQARIGAMMLALKAAKRKPIPTHRTVAEIDGGDHFGG